MCAWSRGGRPSGWRPSGSGPPRSSPTNWPVPCTRLTTTDQQVPLLLLVLGTPPPIRVARVGTLDIPEAVEHSLAQFDDQQDLLAAGAREAVAWITWTELSLAVRRATDLLDVADPSVAASVRRMADAVDRAIAWHS